MEFNKTNPSVCFADTSLCTKEAREIARLRGVDPEEIAKITTENAKRFFGIE